MKTFEGNERIEKGSESDDRKLVVAMYLLRAVSTTLIILLLLYLAETLLTSLYPTPTFPEFILGNSLLAIFLLALVFLGQMFFYIYRLRTGVKIRRSTGEMIVGYALPIIGIIAAVYTAYAIGAM